jgi:hypothetical protein
MPRRGKELVPTVFPAHASRRGPAMPFVLLPRPPLPRCTWGEKRASPVPLGTRSVPASPGHSSLPEWKSRPTPPDARGPCTAWGNREEHDRGSGGCAMTALRVHPGSVALPAPVMRAAGLASTRWSSSQRLHRRRARRPPGSPGPVRHPRRAARSRPRDLTSRGNPPRTTFLAAAAALGGSSAGQAGPSSRTRLAGVQAGRPGGSFAWWSAYDRTGRPRPLRQSGADVVVTDLAELLGRSR